MRFWLSVNEKKNGTIAQCRLMIIRKVFRATFPFSIMRIRQTKRAKVLWSMLLKSYFFRKRYKCAQIQAVRSQVSRKYCSDGKRRKSHILLEYTSAVWVLGLKKIIVKAFGFIFKNHFTMITTIIISSLCLTIVESGSGRCSHFCRPNNHFQEITWRLKFFLFFIWWIKSWEKSFASFFQYA